MADLTAYGLAAEEGEKAARDAIRQALDENEPARIVVFLLDSARHSVAWQDGALTAIALAAMGRDSTSES